MRYLTLLLALLAGAVVGAQEAPKAKASAKKSKAAPKADAYSASLPKPTHAGVRYVDTAGAETLPPSHTHFTAAGTLEIGRRYAEALLALEQSR